MTNEAEVLPIVIPMDQLSPEALHGVIEAFVLEEGTDYGTVKVTLEQKVDQVRRQLQSGEAQIVFYPDSESCQIVRTTPWKR